MATSQEIRSFVDRILRLKQEEDDVKKAIRDVYAEAMLREIDKTGLGQVVTHVRKRGKNPTDFDAKEAVFHGYLALYDAALTHAHAYARVGDGEITETQESAQPHDAAVGGASAEHAPDESLGTRSPEGATPTIESRIREGSPTGEAEDAGLTAGETAIDFVAGIPTARNFDRSTGAIGEATISDGVRGQDVDVGARPATAIPEKVEDGGKDCKASMPSSEGGPISGTAESFAPCTLSHSTVAPPPAAVEQPEAGSLSVTASGSNSPAIGHVSFAASSHIDRDAMPEIPPFLRRDFERAEA